jgi:hypothetical protein
MRLAYAFAREVLPDHTAKFSRKDFTLPQLVVREMLRLSYRKAQAFFRDSTNWLAEIGVTKPPDHHTLARLWSHLYAAPTESDARPGGGVVPMCRTVGA